MHIRETCDYRMLALRVLLDSNICQETEHPTEILRSLSQSSVTLWDSISNCVTTTSFQILSNSYCHASGSLIRWILYWMIGFIAPHTFRTRDYGQLQRYRCSTHFQYAVPHALGFSVFTSRILATDFITVSL
jgi:hypothetical protein